MSADTDELACPVLRKLVDLLETGRDTVGDGRRASFRERLAEIELDALLLGSAPGTRTLIQITREIMSLSDSFTAGLSAASRSKTMNLYQ